MEQINYRTTGVKNKDAQLTDFGGRYIVFNGWKDGRRQDIFATYIKELAEAELQKRLN